MDGHQVPGAISLPSLKLTASLPLKMDGWNTILSYWDGPFSGAMLVSGRVCFVDMNPVFKQPRIS